ncbi:hypothetical protein V8F06_000938 [Rhypophila decipiens]
MTLCLIRIWLYCHGETYAHQWHPFVTISVSCQGRTLVHVIFKAARFLPPYPSSLTLGLFPGRSATVHGTAVILYSLEMLYICGLYALELYVRCKTYRQYVTAF